VRTDKDDDGAPSAKRRKVVDDSPIHLHPDVEAAIAPFEKDFTAKGFHNSKMFPKEMESELTNIANIAMKNHPNGFITSDVIRRLCQFINLTETVRTY